MSCAHLRPGDPSRPDFGFDSDCGRPMQEPREPDTGLGSWHGPERRKRPGVDRHNRSHQQRSVT
jgi:hypothetical protein